MRNITIVGTGMGPDTLTVQGKAAIDSASVLFGADRLIDTLGKESQRCYRYYTADKIREVMEAENYDRGVLLVSGDTGFYSASLKIKEQLSDYEIDIYPGISSVNYFFAKLQIPWQNAKLVSRHGRDCNFVDTVRRNPLTFSLIGGNSRESGQALCDAGYENLTVHVGENLGSENEKVYTETAAQLASHDTPSLVVLAVENPEADRRILTGIADSRFVRSDVPMTKSAVRAVTMSKLAIKDSDVVYDIGCGTGSCTVEMALAAYNGHVYAADKNETAVSLTKENAKHFHLGNVSVVLQDALEAAKTLPAADAAFVGGGGDELPDIIRTLFERNPKMRVVVNAIALESLAAAMQAFKDNGIEPEITQICASEAKKLGSKHLMMAQNPIYIMSGAKSDE